MRLSAPLGGRCLSGRQQSRKGRFREVASGRLDSDVASYAINGVAMFGIGQFAQLAKVSVRTLRYYDQVGLFEPAAVDYTTGYRSYRASQLPQLNRILALKDLGLSLNEIREMTESGVTTGELVGMLRLRQAEAERAVEAERRRLSRVAARIDLLEGTNMDDIDAAVVVKPLDPLHLGTATQATESFEDDFAPIFERLYQQVFGELARSGVAPDGPHCAYYEQRDDGRVDIVAGVPVPRQDKYEFESITIRDFPPVDRAATLIHRGDMANCSTTYQVLLNWIERAGERPIGYSREVYLDCGEDRSSWVTELQFALASGSER